MVPGLFAVSFEDINLNIFEDIKDFASYNSNYDWMVLCVNNRDQIDVNFFSSLLKLLLRIGKISGGGANTRLGCCYCPGKAPVVFVTLSCNHFQFLIHFDYKLQ